MKHATHLPASRGVVLVLAAVAAFTFAFSPATAQAESDDHVPGEVMIKTKFQFVKFTVNGRSTWENHTYIDRQKTLHIFGLARDRDHTVVVQVRQEGYTPITLEIDATKFKRKRVRRDGARILVYQQVFRPKFKKVAKAPAKDEKAPSKKKRGKKK